MKNKEKQLKIGIQTDKETGIETDSETDKKRQSTRNRHKEKNTKHIKFYILRVKEWCLYIWLLAYVIQPVTAEIDAIIGKKFTKITTLSESDVFK